jgi:hypothetical protein
VKVFYVIFFDNKGPVIQIPAKWQLKKYFESRRPKWGMEYFWLLHDNAPAHKGHIVTEYLEEVKDFFFYCFLYSN